MKKTNFLIENNYALNIEGKHLDLHNNFDLIKLEYLITRNSFSLSWSRTNGEWVQPKDPEHIRIVFENVSFLKLSPSTSWNHEDQKTLSFIGYLHPEDAELMDGCLDENEADSTYHMIISFQDGFAIKVLSASATCFLG